MSRVVVLRRSFSLSLLIVALGCGGTSNNRKAVSGKVTAPGNAEAAGMISFYPAAGTKGPSATAAITAGKYAFTSEDGPAAGAYRIVIDLTAPAASNAAPPAGVDIKAQGLGSGGAGVAIPPPQAIHFETDWTVPVSGSLQKDFQIGS